MTLKLVECFLQLFLHSVVLYFCFHRLFSLIHTFKFPALYIRKICFSPKNRAVSGVKYSPVFESNLTPSNQDQYSPIS